MRTPILILVCLVLATACQAAKKQVGRQEQIKQQAKLEEQKEINQRLKSQEERLQEIKESAAMQRQGIEDWYEYRLAELQERTKEKARKLKKPIALVWAEFINENKQIPYADGYFSKTHPTFVRDRKIYKLRVALSDRYFLGAAQNFLMDEEARKLLDAIVNSGVSDATISKGSLIWKEARKVFVAMKKLESELIRIQSRKKFLLAQLNQWEKDLREDVFRVMREIKAQPETPELGVVSAISYGPNQAFVMIDGTDRELIYQGSKINNVKVVKIKRDKVEFEKNGKKWMQGIGEAANPAWTKPN